MITVSGFFLNVLYFLVTLYYTGFSGSTDIPSWACYFSAFAYCLYITLDNMDGKQARRTKSSSPLGILVDHGTDATTTFWITMGLGSILYWWCVLYVFMVDDNLPLLFEYMGGVPYWWVVSSDYTWGVGGYVDHSSRETNDNVAAIPSNDCAV